MVSRDSLGRQTAVDGATVTELKRGITQRTDSSGWFRFSVLGGPPYLLQVAHPDFATDTLLTQESHLELVLRPIIVLSSVEVQASERSTYLSALAVRPTEIISRQQLENTACCNLSESFEATATVDANFSDAVTGFRQIRMLGLAGRYAQLLTEAIPTLRGLANSVGLSYFPGPWMRSVAVSKGTGSVVNGYDAITGQINVELFRPDSGDVLFLNGYVNNEQRLEGNAISRQQISPHLSHMLLAHGAIMEHHMDANSDHFMDQPVTRQILLMDRWLYQVADRLEFQFSAKGVYDDRYGGEIHFNPKTDKLDSLRYGFGMNVLRGEAAAKIALMFPDRPQQSLGLQLFSAWHDQDGYFGLKEYTATEGQFYGNLIFSSALGNTMHRYKAGVSWFLIDKKEQFGLLLLDRRQSAPGAFAEYTFDDLEHWTVVAGLRGDVHNLFGIQVSPRLHVRYKPAAFTAIRLTAGSGFRAAEPLMDNAGYLASSRRLVIAPELDAEKAWNAGIGFTQEAKLLGREVSLMLDAFRTQFISQVVVDADSDPQELRIYNLSGSSFSNVLQAEAGLCPVDRLEVRFSYRLSDVQLTIGEQLREQPYTPRHRGVGYVTYTTANQRWSAAVIGQWVGSQRLPDTRANPEDYQMPERSAAYTRLIAQVQHRWKNWEFYIGSENLTNVIQQDRIIAANDPFGPYFDASFVWGPLTGRMVYGGFRFALPGKSKG